jgi:hypothetical protein
MQSSAVAFDERDDGAGHPSALCVVEAPPTVAHINPVTGLATDYLNHFNEAIMLLEMLRACPDCRDDLRAWTPMNYCEHFRQSHFSGRDRAIAAYEAADPATRDMLDAVTGTMTAMVEHARKAIDAESSARLSADIAERAAAWLKLLAAQAGAIINGRRIAGPDGTPQSAVDRMIG